MPKQAPISSPDSETDDGTTPEADSDTAAPAEPPTETVEVTYKGITWTVPKNRGEWDMNVGFEMEDGRRLIGTCILLGGDPGNVQKVREQIYSVCRTAAEVDDFMSAVADILNRDCVG